MILEKTFVKHLIKTFKKTQKYRFYFILCRFVSFNILRNFSMENCRFGKRINELWAESEILHIPESDFVEAPITNRKRASKEEKVIF